FSPPGASKWDIRQKVWDYIEGKDLANFPRPVHHRIPNFKGAPAACSRVPELQVFSQAAEVKVDPDKPLQGARLAVLQARKTLLVPTPRLRTGLFNKITPPRGASKEQLRICSSSQGVKEFSLPVGLDATVKVDLVVVGSVAVSEKGFRIGKGEGFADMEYGMMASMGAVSDSTVVVTIVHDCQVVNIPEELVDSHDLTVDYILTPTQVIKTNCQHPKPQGIIWSKLDKEKLEKVPILQRLRSLEQRAGRDVTLGAEHPKRGEEPSCDRRAGGSPDRETKEVRGQDRTGGERGKEEGGGEVTPRSVTTVYLGGIPAGLRVSELKRVLREGGSAPLRLTWHAAQHRAFLDYSDPQAAEHALRALQELSVKGYALQAEVARRQRGD
uniref:Methenyltetrahydrofolate synthase domain-containing protein n=1 Tax=Tetraodon nigroviridis TaxID=99883 RepID=H3CV67_TETNG